MDTVVERRRQLYGPERSLAKQQICRTLTKSHILQDGEYNYTTDQLKDGIWQTSSKRDFPRTEVSRDNVPTGVSQLDHHFCLGNDTGKEIPAEVYQGSTTKDDYNPKDTTRPAVLAEDRTINWPDMAPRYATDRYFGESEYKNTFMMADRAQTAPAFPRVNTLKMKLPLDPQQFTLQRKSHFKFGHHDEPSGVSEHMRTYGRAVEDDLSSKLASTGDVLKIRAKMKENDMTSNIFRGGDYNGIAHNYETTNVGDYGPRTRPPAEILASQIHQEQLRKEKGTEEKSVLLKNVPNELTSYARSHTVPGVFKDANDGRYYQTAAHFKFGSDTDGVSSIYRKDFAPGAMATRSRPKFYEPPSAGKLFQNDPEYFNFGTASSKTDFMFQAMPEKVGADGKTTIERNIERRHGDNVTLSHDLQRHADDRQKSLSHGDYKAPPSNFKAMKPIRAPTVEFDYLQTNDALPYDGLPHLSEAKNSFGGAFMVGIQAMERQRQKVQQCRDRIQMCRGSHFAFGYSGPDQLISETANRFDGRPKSDMDTPAAGKTEGVPAGKFGHLNISENTLDMKANDPYVSSTKEALKIRNQFEPAVSEEAFATSVMKSDFKPLAQRSLNSHQHRMLDKYKAVTTKNIEQSHFFHLDGTGRSHEPDSSVALDATEESDAAAVGVSGAQIALDESDFSDISGSEHSDSDFSEDRDLDTDVDFVVNED